MKYPLALLLGFIMSLLPAHAHANRVLSAGECDATPHYGENAFSHPMTFFYAYDNGRLSSSVWIAAVGEITEKTPADFEDFLAGLDRQIPSSVRLHSPGGSLAAGLQLGEMFRQLGLSTEVGRTTLVDMEADFPCRTTLDSFEAGKCLSACAYAFLGGVRRTVYFNAGSRLGFHQFWGSEGDATQALSPEEAAQLQASTLSAAQYITGEIIQYVMRMGVDPGVIALASSTGPAQFSFPDKKAAQALRIISLEGYSSWQMRAAREGIITSASALEPNVSIQKVSAFCDSGGPPMVLLEMQHEMDGFGLEKIFDEALVIESGRRRVILGKSHLEVRKSEDGSNILVFLDGQTANLIEQGLWLSMTLGNARVFGFHQASFQLSDLDRKSIRLAWRNCI